jgi:cell wall-associated NlpC family hydrolase
MRGGAMKIVAAALAAVVGLVTLVIIMFAGSDESDENKCMASSTGGSAVSAEGFAEPITDAKNHISSTYKSPERPGHKGIDIAVPNDSPIYAVYDGTVEDAGPASGFGQWIVIEHNIDGKRWSSVYGHMYESGVLVHTGDKVTAGQHIGNVGSNGESSGPHLHWEMWDGGRLTGGTETDPTPFLDKVGEGGGGATSAGGSNEQASSSGPAKRLVVIGDSTTVQIEDRLQSELDSQTDYDTVTIDAIGGTSLYEGGENGVNRIRTQKGSGGKADWFIGMGVNDAANISAGSARSAAQRIDDVMELLGDQGTVWWPEVRSGPNPATPAPDLPGAATKFNQALHTAEGRYSNLKIVAWNPGNDVYTDDIHYNSKGMDERVKMIATVTSGGSYTPSAGGGDSGSGSGDVQAPGEYRGAGDVKTEYINEGQSVPLGIPDDVGALSEVQLDHARRMIAAGKGRGVDDEVIKAMLMAGLQESGLRMLASRAVPESLSFPNDGVTPGDATSVGFFQIQTPMNMPVNEAMDPNKQISWWLDTFESLSSPDKAAWEIAADVERPREDLRGEYRKWEDAADELLRTQGNISPSSNDCDNTSSGSSSDGTPPADLKEFADQAVEAARKQMGQDYVWGGGDWDGPTGGGFDCSGLTMYAYAQASGGSIKLNHYTTDQLNDSHLEDVPLDKIAKGDLVFFGDPADPHHVGLAISNTQMIHAPDFGDVVKESTIADLGDLSSARRLKETPK